MFEYVRNEYNPAPRLVIDPAPARPGFVVRHLEHSTSIVCELPDDVEKLHLRHTRKHRGHLRAKERKFRETFADAQFSYLTGPDEIAARLPEVQRLFAERWSDEYTSLQWKTARGFAPHAQALITLAGQGRGALAVLDGGGRMLSFGYCLLDGDWCHLLQHAATSEEKYRSFSPGTIFLNHLMEHLVTSTDIRHLDLMLGDQPYKRALESWRRPVYLRIEEPDTPAGRARLQARVLAARAHMYVQFGNPRLRTGLKAALLVGQRLRLRLARAPLEAAR